MNFEVLDFPWSHGYSKNFVDDQFAKQMSDDFPEWMVIDLYHIEYIGTASS